MDSTELLKKIHQAEEELDRLKNQIQPNIISNKFITQISSMLRFFRSNWGLLAAIATAIIAYLAFGVNPLESYENVSTARKLSAFYTVQGDKLLASQEWEAAADAYRRAVEINRYNTEATYGIAKAEVFVTPKGEKYYVPEVARAKLDYLLEHFPNDYLLDYLNGLLFLIQADNNNAEIWFQKCLAEKSDFAAAYIGLGYIYQRTSNLQKARDNYEKALELQPDSISALNNVGFLDLLDGEFSLAEEHLERAEKQYPTLLTELNLGDAYLYLGLHKYALYLHQFALYNLREPGIENERYVGSLWLYNYMPLKAGDIDTIKQYVEVSRFADKQMFAHYAVSFDHAILGDFENADKEFSAAIQLDPANSYSTFFGLRILSIENFLKLDSATKAWFDRKLQILIPY